MKSICSPHAIRSYGRLPTKLDGEERRSALVLVRIPVPFSIQHSRVSRGTHSCEASYYHICAPYVIRGSLVRRAHRQVTHLETRMGAPGFQRHRPATATPPTLSIAPPPAAFPQRRSRPTCQGQGRDDTLAKKRNVKQVRDVSLQHCPYIVMY